MRARPASAHAACGARGAHILVSFQARWPLPCSLCLDGTRLSLCPATLCTVLSALWGPETRGQEGRGGAMRRPGGAASGGGGAHRQLRRHQSCEDAGAEGQRRREGKGRGRGAAAAGPRPSSLGPAVGAEGERGGDGRRGRAPHALQCGDFLHWVNPHFPADKGTLGPGHPPGQTQRGVSHRPAHGSLSQAVGPEDRTLRKMRTRRRVREERAEVPKPGCRVWGQAARGQGAGGQDGVCSWLHARC